MRTVAQQLDNALAELASAQQSNDDTIVSLQNWLEDRDMPGLTHLGFSIISSTEAKVYQGNKKAKPQSSTPPQATAIPPAQKSKIPELSPVLGPGPIKIPLATNL